MLYCENSQLKNSMLKTETVYYSDDLDDGKCMYI